MRLSLSLSDMPGEVLGAWWAGSETLVQGESRVSLSGIHSILTTLKPFGFDSRARTMQPRIPVRSSSKTRRRHFPTSAGR